MSEHGLGCFYKLNGDGTTEKMDGFPSSDDWFGRWHLVTDIGDYRVSTIFLIIDHAYGIGTPVLFETMVFHNGEGAGVYQQRYTTKKAAESGHQDAIELVKNGVFERG